MGEIDKQVLRNFVVRIGGYSAGSVLFFLTFVLIARYLSTEGFGHFSFIMAFVGIFQLVADMGVRNILIRDIALNKSDFRRYLGIARLLLWSLSLLSMGLIVLIANMLNVTEEVRQSIYIAGLAVIFIFYGLGYSAVLRAFEEMGWDILIFVVHKVIFISLIWFVQKTDYGLRGVFVALLIANASQWLYFWTVVSIRHGRAKISLDWKSAWALLSDAFPLGIAEILRRLTRHVDKLLLAALGTPLALGLFSAAYKFLESIHPFTLNVTLPLFPVFARLAQSSQQKFFQTYEQSLKFLFVMGIPLAVILFIFSERIVMMFFGEAYHDAALTLRILAPAIMIMLPTSIYGYVFISLGRQKMYLRCIIVSLVVNTVLDLMLIPSYSHIGAAIGTLSAEISLFVSGDLLLKHLHRKLVCLQLMWRPLLACLPLGAICWSVREGSILVLLVAALCGGATYAVSLYILQTFSRQERALLTDALRIKIGWLTR
jgi:O-antigen/teichoic acid export membrane protein